MIHGRLPTGLRPLLPLASLVDIPTASALSLLARHFSLVMNMGKTNLWWPNLALHPSSSLPIRSLDRALLRPPEMESLC